MNLNELEVKVYNNTFSNDLFDKNKNRLLISSGTQFDKKYIDMLLNRGYKVNIEHVDLPNNDINGIDEPKYGILDSRMNSLFNVVHEDHFHSELGLQMLYDVRKNKEIGQEINKIIVGDFKKTFMGNMFFDSIDCIKTMLYTIANKENNTNKKASKEGVLQTYENKIKIALDEELEKDPMTHVYLESLRVYQGDYTFSHSLFVAKWAITLASSLNLYSKLFDLDLFFNLEETCIAALTHDIGKLDKDIQDILYIKEWTKKEVDLMKKHPIIGRDMLMDKLNIVGNKAVKSAYEHHEKFDGSGYPKGNGNVDMMSALVSIADKFDAIFFKRFYRKKEFTIPEAINILIKEVYGDNSTSIFYNKYFMNNGEIIDNGINLGVYDPFYGPLSMLFKITKLKEVIYSKDFRYEYLMDVA
ncbi:HD-GYP domain-containing protein [Nanoarchaeota archaeon]